MNPFKVVVRLAVLMNLGFVKAGGSAASQPSKRGRLGDRDKKEADKREEVVSLIAKLTLSNALQARIQKAITCRCYKMKEESPWIKAHQNARQSYTENQIKAKNNGLSVESFKEQNGTPYVWGSNAIIALFIKVKTDKMKELEDKGGEEAVVAEMKKDTEMYNRSVAAWENWEGWKLIHKCIPHSQVSRMFRREDKRLEIGCPMLEEIKQNPDAYLLTHPDTKEPILRPDHLFAQIEKCIIKERAREMLGVAPAGDLERKIQQWLDGQNEKDEE